MTYKSKMKRAIKSNSIKFDSVLGHLWVARILCGMVLEFGQFQRDLPNWQRYLPAFVIAFALASVQILALNTKHVHHSQLSLESIHCNSKEGS